MQRCKTCGCTDFYKDSGYFYCAICQTQNEDIREEIVEIQLDATTKLRKKRIQRIRNDKTDEELGWTSWELYNFVLIGLTNEIIELGAPNNIKVTVLQLWARYLGKLEVAFTSTKKKLIPKLSRKYNKRDAEIIYGKTSSQKKVRKRKKAGSSVTGTTGSNYESDMSSTKELNRNKKLMINAEYDRYMQSQTSSEGDALSTFNQSVYSMASGTKQSSVKANRRRIQFNSSAKEETRKIKEMAKKVPKHKRVKYRQSFVTARYKMGPELIGPTKLWAILYLALRIHNHPIHLGDMLRYAKEGHLSYYKLDHLIPPEIILTTKDVNFLSQAMDITHNGMRRIIGSMAKFLGITKIICPNFSPFIRRYCTELNLPRGISLYAERLIALSPPKMKFDRKTHIPNYEGRAMAFIIVILKTLLALDGITEYEISNIADNLNSEIDIEGISDKRLFSFREWQRYIECRKTILVNTHFPTRLKYNPNIPDINSLYIKFLEFIRSKNNRDKPEITTNKDRLPRNLSHAMSQCITNINYIDLPLNEVNVFAPTLTPHHSYLQQLLEHPMYDLPIILRNDFFSTKVSYMTKPQYIHELALRYNKKIDIIDSNMHFFEKMVSFFEQPKIASIKDLKVKITVHDFMEEEIECPEEKEDFTNYLHKKVPGQFKINSQKKQYYDEMRKRTTNIHAPSLATSNEFIFNETFADGRLLIPDMDNNDNDEDDNEDDEDDSKDTPEKTKLLSDFCKAYNINLSTAEKAVMLENSNLWEPKLRFENAHDRSIKQNDVFLGIQNSSEDNNYTEQIEMTLADFDIKDNTPEISDILNNSNDLSIIDSVLTKAEVECDDLFGNCNFLYDNKSPEFAIDIPLYISNDETNNTLRLFRPFKNYWMYNCKFSCVRLKNFELLEKMLPKSFRWLLNECASILEMSTEDLYEEVCLIEAYYANIPEQSKNHISYATNDESCRYINTILSKW